MRASILGIGLFLVGSLDAAPVPSVEDAPLRSVRFIDKNEGWAVGDQGLILHSIDGGKSWERQSSGTRASLRAVRFLTPYFGHVVGRLELPHAAGSAGVILVTTDGGATWKELASTFPCGLNTLHFFDESRGIVAGDGTDAAPGGLFKTSDGGRTWSPIPSVRVDSWRQIIVKDLENGRLSGTSGTAELKAGRIEAITMPATPFHAVHALVNLENPAPLVGGKTPRLGNSREELLPPGVIAPEAGDAFDVRAASTYEKTIIAVGRPGSVVFRSRDEGKSWTTHKTPITAPLHDVQLLDEKIGWAVGDFGTILGTTDGGDTWTTLRSSGTRAAVLFAQARGVGTPLGALASLSHEGHLCAVSVLAKGEESRLGAAVRLAGGAVGETDATWTLPGYLSESKGSEEPEPMQLARDPVLTARLVLSIRMWRPEVVVMDLLAPDAPLADKIALLHVKEAFQLAADPKAFPEQQERLGLAPHSVKKLYARTSTKEAEVVLDLARYRPEFEGAIQDHVEEAANLLNVDSPATIGFRLVAHRLPGSEKHQSLLEGIDLPEGGTARRKIEKRIALLDEAESTKICTARRKLDATIDELLAQDADIDATKTLSQILGELGRLPETVAAKSGVTLGYRLVRAGRWTAARELFVYVAERHPACPESVEALRWLLKYQASGEVRRQLELGRFPIYQKNAFSPLTGEKSNIIRASHTETGKTGFRFRDDEAFRQWNQACLDLEPKLAGFGPSYQRTPATQLCFAAARRQLGSTAPTERAFKHLMQDSSDLWSTRLADELLVASGKEPRSPFATVGVAESRPKLDGKLDEACWSSAGTMELRSKLGNLNDDTATTAQFTSDDEFLYIAVTCKKPTGKAEPKAEKRTYDADLTGCDRVEILLDQDRDYQTAYRLRIDSRGRTADDCWGDASWNPKWFVAVEPTENGWTAECAIPWSQLTKSAPRAGEFWTANVVRVIPGAGVRSWGSVTDTPVRPDSMGLLKMPKR